MSEFLGLDWVFVGPESAAVLPCIHFCRGVGWRLVEALIMPSVTGSEHFKVYVSAIDKDDAEDASVLVALGVFDADILAGDERGKMLARGFAERLGFLGRVDCVEANLVLRLRRVEHGDGIAVDYLDDASAHFRARGRATRNCRAVRPRDGYAASPIFREGGGVFSTFTDAAERGIAANPPTIKRTPARADLAVLSILCIIPYFGV